MLGTEDRFAYELALDLGKTLGEVEAMPNAEYVRWRAFYRYRHEMRKLYG